MSEPCFVVVGASGTVGREVVRRLTNQGHSVLGLVHKPRPAERPEVKYRPWDLAEPDSLPAFDGAAGVFLMTPIHPDMVAIGERLNRAAANASVTRIVRLSIASVMHRPGVFAGQAHAQIDHDLLAQRADALVLRPHGFMQNLLGLAKAIKSGQLPQPVDPAARDAMIDACDIARAAVVGLLGDNPGGTFDLTGPEAISAYDIAERLTALTGRRITAVALSDDQARQAMRGFGMSNWLIERILEFRTVQEAGVTAQVGDAVQRLTGIGPGSLMSFLKVHADQFHDPV